MSGYKDETTTASANVPMPDDAALAAAGLDRRDFLRLSGTLAAAAAITASGCAPPAETSVPFHHRPENNARLGKLKRYATVLGGTSVLVRCREGRPIGIVPNPDDPSGRCLTVRSHAALLDLYDPDRATGPLFVQRGRGAVVQSRWSTIGTEVVESLKARRPEEGGGDVVLLTGPVTGPGTRALLDELRSTLKLRHVVYQPLATDAPTNAWRAAGGEGVAPRPCLDQADLIVGFGAEFIDSPADGLERDFAVRRAPDAPGGMNRFVQLEGRLTLTGANADQRVRVRDSQLANVAAALAHELIVARKVGRLANDATVAKALAPFANAAGVDRARITALAEELAKAGSKAVVLAGGSASYGANGAALEAAVALLNASLSGYGAPCFRPAMDDGTSNGFAALSALVEDMKAGKVSMLLVAGPNPVYDAPLDFAGAMAKVKLVVSLNDRVDETSAHADYLAPASHSLESWSDARIAADLVALQQPVIRPLYDTYGLWDILVAWGASAGAGGAIEAAQAKTRPAKEGDAPPEQQSGAYHYLRAHWLGSLVSSPAELDQCLRRGHLVNGSGGTAELPQGPALASLATKLGTPAPTAGELELQLYPHFAVDDGRAGNNGWLQELPDPVTRLTWGGAVSIAPKRFDAMGISNGDLVTLTVAGKTIELPAYRHAGMHEDQLAVPLGLGRTGCGEVGAEVGVNAFPLQQTSGGRVLRSGLAVELAKAGGHVELASAQGADVVDREVRPIVPLTELSAFQKSPESGTEQFPGGPSIWKEHEYPAQKWGMTIDLSKCNGCGKCTLACQAENNIPVVGRQGIIDGREMSWIRIDRYYDAPKRAEGWGDDVYDGLLEVVEEPVTVFQPMLCQHCENAPCETVCPFNATMHSEDGLNQQIYNRCVGTRYCANNCPFKVRRYNWYEYSKPQTAAFFKLLFPVLERHAALNTRGRMQMKNNPEVTVRSRGVMEKCSFCVQRIREARADAIRRGEPGKLAEGAVVPACMECCPTGAITFGDLNDPSSETTELSANPRAMRLLESTGVKPVISYLTKVRNDLA